MFLTLAQLELSLRELERFHMFYGTTFLVFKKGRLPIGDTTEFAIVSEERKFLNEYYKPKKSSNWYYRPMRSSTQKDRLWLDKKYPGGASQSTRTRGEIASAFIHERNTQIWGWRENYVSVLKARLPAGKKIPIFHLAVWLYRERDWALDTVADDVIKFFVEDFLINSEELENLFDLTLSNLSDVFLEKTRIAWEDLEQIIGSPPDSLPGEGGTLTYLELHGVGPASEICLEPAERLNLITGDNGLGKTFILECMWWALTGQWSSLPAYPRRGADSNDAQITFAISGGSRNSERVTISYSRKNQRWESPRKRPTIPGLLVYARVDSSFAVWDPERFNEEGDSLSLIFSRDQVWNGLTVDFRGGYRSYSEGLLRDWLKWQSEPPPSPFHTFKQVLRRLSPSDMNGLEPGPPTRTSYDAREIPTIIHSYGVTPIIYAAAGIKRIIALAYFIVWAWSEHQKLSAAHNKKPQRKMVVLIDEMEAHLHPRWQRIILSALLEIGKDLSSDLEIQFIIATHSPLVMASVEPYFRLESDKLFHLYLSQEALFESEVYLEEVPFTKYGTSDAWLMSDVFDSTSPRSVEATQAIQKAMHLQRQEEPSINEVREVSKQLRQFLAADDEFWPLWKYFSEQRGVYL